MPTGAAIALATAGMMVTARRLTARLPRLADQTPESLAAAVAVVRAGLLAIWPDMPPEAVRDVMMGAAEAACEAGITGVPEDLAGMLPGLDAAEGMLELTGEWIAEGKPEPTPPLMFASSVAFDRSEDAETLASLSVLLTLAHLVMPTAAAGTLRG
jgi:hypothetical protein